VITGLYTLLFPVVVFAVFGSSRHLVVSADSATAAMVAAALTSLSFTANTPRYIELTSMRMAPTMPIVSVLIAGDACLYFVCPRQSNVHAKIARHNVHSDRVASVAVGEWRAPKRPSCEKAAHSCFHNSRLGIPKLDIRLLTKVVGKDRTIEQATRSEKRAASVGLHSFRHANATAMDSLCMPQQVRKQRLGHSGNSVTENYMHTFTQDERDAAEKLGEFFGTGWPEVGEKKVISFPNLSQKEEGLPIGGSEALVNQ